MQIDWITVAAQIVNFLILVWLLNLVLYRPLNRALQERAAAVQERLAATAAAEAAARAAEAEHRAATQALADERADLLAAATAAAEDERRDLLHRAQGEIATRRREWAEELAAEQAAFLDRVRRRAGDAFVTLARNALAEMADRDLLEQMARVFARRLATLGADERAALAANIADGAAVAVLAPFDLSPEARAIIAEAVGRLLAPNQPAPEIAFRAEPEMDSGVMLVVGSRHIGWTLGEHLDTMADDIAAQLAGADPAAVAS